MKEMTDDEELWRAITWSDEAMDIIDELSIFLKTEIRRLARKVAEYMEREKISVTERQITEVVQPLIADYTARSLYLSFPKK